MILETSQPKLARGCRFGSDDMLLVPEGVLRLKGPAAEILRRCDGQKMFSEIVYEMRQQFNGVVESDVQEFLGKLVERGFVEC
jgi:pyrroloquinoline quinone biosynthesis protein D